MSAAGPPGERTVSPSQGQRIQSALAAPGAACEQPPGQTVSLSEAGQAIRCPSCHVALPRPAEPTAEVRCPACGTTFHIRDAPPTVLTSAGRLGKFQLLERVGQGAFGIVWKARDTELGRLVALKVPHASLLEAPGGRERFEREARAAAQLRHPGIVTVHEVTTAEGQPAIVSDFIEGLSLRDLLRVRDLTFREAADLVAALAEALDYAHVRGLVHRDVKPGNVMMEGQRPAPDEGRNGPVGRPLVTDFGLALRGEAEMTLTLDGQVVGTPAYMSPEQAAGRGHHVDRRSDVYSLGVVLYELLCGELPFRGTCQVILHQVLYEEPRPPRHLNDKVPRDLETICLKALAKSPGRRYATAGDLAEDLRCFLDGRPIRARPVRSWEKLLLWARRRPAAAGLLLASVVAVLALGGLGVGWFYHTRLQKALHGETAERDRAQAALERERVHLSINRVLLAHGEWRDNNVSRAAHLLQECPEDLRCWEWHYLHRLCQATPLNLEGHTGLAFAVAFSLDGRRLASASMDGTVKVWDPATGREISTLRGHNGAVTSIAFAPNGRSLATGSWDHAVKVWNLASSQEVLTFEEPCLVNSVAFSPDGRQLAVGLDKGLKLHDAGTGKAIRTFPEHGDATSSVAFAPDGKRLAGCSAKAVTVWDLTTGQQVLTLSRTTKDTNSSVTFTPDGKRLLCNAGRTIKVWDAASGQELLSFPGLRMAASPDGKWLASGNWNQTITLRDAATGNEVQTLRGRTLPALSMAFSSDGKWLASGGGDVDFFRRAEVKVWNLRNAQESLAVAGHTNWANCVSFTHDGRCWAGGADKNTVKVWDAATGRLVHSFQGHRREVNRVVFAPDGRRAASSSPDQMVKVWDLQTGREVDLPGMSASWDAPVAFSTDGQHLAVAKRIGEASQRKDTHPDEIEVWDLHRRQAVLSLKGFTTAVSGLAFSADGAYLAAAFWDRTVKVWEKGGREIHRFGGHAYSIRCVVFSPDGKYLAAADGEFANSGPVGGEVKVWDLRTGTLAFTLQGQGGPDVSLAFSPDGRRLASSSKDSRDETVRLWDMVTGQEAFTLKDVRAHGLAFSLDGQRLAAISVSGTRIWDATPP